VAGTGGRIIFVSATLHYAGTPLQLHASAAKAAIDSMSATICIEEGPRGLTSNTIAPGAIGGTEGMDRLALPNATYEHVPSGRAGLVKEIADATVYLFSDAGNYVNGANLVVDGGGWRTGNINLLNFVQLTNDIKVYSLALLRQVLSIRTFCYLEMMCKELKAPRNRGYR
jgi:enoyl-[acyl-carrier-protein] reductase (NADH)